MQAIPNVLVLLAVLFTFVACGGTRSTRQAQLEHAASNVPDWKAAHVESTGVPPWADQPHSWSKLEAIGAWLKHQGHKSDPFWRVEARLQLAEGRMAFYQSEYGEVDARTNQERAANARADFMRVRSDPQATESQVRRAERGLRSHGSPARAVPGALPDGVLPRSSWQAQAPRRDRVNVADVPWSIITLHHSASETPLTSLHEAGGAKSALRKIQAFHMNQNGWGDVGYHFFIDPAGRVYEGRSMAYQGAHAGTDGDHNNNPGNIGICLLGNFDTERPTRAAIDSMNRLVKELRSTYSIGPRAVRAHLDWKQTQCPGKHLLPYVRQLTRH